MTAKEYLSQAYWLDRRINSKLEQLSYPECACDGRCDRQDRGYEGRGERGD